MKLSPIITFLSLFSLLLLLGSCDKEEPIPAYLHIDTTYLTTQMMSEGSASHLIRNAWVFVNDQTVGAYELPAVIPIIADGETKVSVQAGIANNGIISTRKVYPFYTNANKTIMVSPNEDVTYNPTFAYKSGTVFELITDFDFANNFEETTGNATLQMLEDQSLVFEGERSAHIELSGSDTVFSIRSLNPYPLPTTVNFDSFIELNYKCTAPFHVFIEAYTPTSSVGIQSRLLTINTKENWNKIYIDLNQAVQSFGAQNYKQFRIVIKGTLPANQTQASFYWDNIKLLHN